MGYAYTDSDRVEVHQSGVWNLKPRRHEGGGMRYLRVRRTLEELLHAPNVTRGFNGSRIAAVFYEEVAAHKGTAAAHIYGGIVATIASVCEELSVPYQGIPVGTVKKRATGKGNCDKEAMILAAIDTFVSDADLLDPMLSGLGITSDRADALWVLAVGLEELGYVID